MAFTDYETEQLRKALLKETRRCAVTLGMKKTSVDQLTKAVGIAKGSFYKFYESKEMLFFAVLEGVHSELYNVADRALSENGGVPPSERTAKAVLAVCKRLSDTGDMVFIENDAKLLLQRLPEKPAVRKEEVLAAGAIAGRSVVHTVFGPGRITAYKDPVVTIRFPKSGEKHFILSESIKRGLLRYEDGVTG